MAWYSSKLGRSSAYVPLAVMANVCNDNFRHRRSLWCREHADKAAAAAMVRSEREASCARPDDDTVVESSAAEADDPPPPLLEGPDHWAICRQALATAGKADFSSINGARIATVATVWLARWCVSGEDDVGVVVDDGVAFDAVPPADDG